MKEPCCIGNVVSCSTVLFSCVPCIVIYCRIMVLLICMLNSRRALTHWLTTLICLVSAAVTASLDPILLWMMVQVIQSWQQLIRPFPKQWYLAKTRLEGRSLWLLHSLMESVLSQPAADHGLLQPRRAHLCQAADSISVARLQCLQQHDACKSTKVPLFLVSSYDGQHLSLPPAAACLSVNQSGAKQRYSHPLSRECWLTTVNLPESEIRIFK